MATVLLGRHTIRLAVNLANPPTYGQLLDYGRKRSDIVLPHGVDIDIEVGLFDGNIQSATEPDVMDLTNVSSISLKVMPSQDVDDGGELIDIAVSSGSIAATIAAADFKAGTAEHFTVTITDDEASISMSPAGDELTKRTLWLVLTANMSNGDEVPIGCGVCEFVQTNNAQNGTPPANPGQTLSTAQIQAEIDSRVGVSHAYTIAGGTKTGTLNWQAAAGGGDTTLAGAPDFVIADFDAKGYRVVGITNKTTTGFDYHLSSDRHSGGTLSVLYKL